MAKMKLIEFGMDDPMERLYYERQERRKKAYYAKHRRALKGNRKEPATAGQMDRYGFSYVASAIM